MNFLCEWMWHGDIYIHNRHPTSAGSICLPASSFVLQRSSFALLHVLQPDNVCICVRASVWVNGWLGWLPVNVCAWVLKAMFKYILLSRTDFVCFWFALFRGALPPPPPFLSLAWFTFRFHISHRSIKNAYAMIITHTPCVPQPFGIYEKQCEIEQQAS